MALKISPLMGTRKRNWRRWWISSGSGRILEKAAGCEGRPRVAGCGFEIQDAGAAELPLAVAELRRSQPRSQEPANPRRPASVSIACASDEPRSPPKSLKLQLPRPDLQTRLRPVLVNELRRTRTQNLPDRRTRHAQIPADPLDRTALPEMGSPDLPDLVHSQHPPPRSSELPKEQLNTHRKGITIERRSNPKSGHPCMPSHRPRCLTTSVLNSPMTVSARASS